MIGLFWLILMTNLAHAKELTVGDIKIGEKVYTGVDGSGGFEARMFDKNHVDLYNKDGPKIVTTYDANGNATKVEEWTKEKRMYVRNANGELANVYCVQHGTLFGVGSERYAEDMLKVMDQITLNKVAAAIDYLRSKGISAQEEYFAVQSFIWSIQDGNESFGYSFGDASVQKHPYEEINQHILNQQDEYFYGDYHGKGILFGSVVEQDVGMFSYTKDTDKNAKMKTTARDGEDKDKVVKNGAVKLVDRVEYCGLLTTKEYTLKGVLMKRPSGEPLEIDGKQVTAETKFTPKTTGCDVAEVIFVFDASELKEDEHLVVFEELWRSGRKIIEHKDLFDDGQTVRVSERDDKLQKVSVDVNVNANATSKADAKNEQLEQPMEPTVPLAPRSGHKNIKSEN